MSKPVQSVPAISYALSIFYGASFVTYWATAGLPGFGLHGITLVLISLVLFCCSLGTAKLKEPARHNMITFNVIMWIYLLVLLKYYPDFVQPSYILMNIIVVLFFSQPSIKLQFIPALSGVRKSVLVVDDDEGLVKTVQRILLKSGYSVLTATSGEKGIQIAKLQRPDLIILDVILPGVKGREVCQRLKDDEQTARIPVMFLTAKDSEDDIRAEKAVGAETHLTKPVNARILLSEVKKILR